MESFSRKKLSFVFIILYPAVLLAFGLYPFNLLPLNNVHTSVDHSALRFNEGDIGNKYNPRGIVMSNQEIRLPVCDDTTIFSIELILRCRQISKNNLCTIFSLSKDMEEFLILEQWNDIFQVRSAIKIDDQTEYRQIGVANAFPKDSLQVFQIAFTKKGTYVNINHERAGYFPYFYLTIASPGDSFQIILGNSLTGKNPWNGELCRLALYQSGNSNRPGDKVHPVEGKSPGLSDSLLYLFDFNEATNSKVMDKVQGKAFLYVPPYFTILKKNYLTWRWNERKWNSVLFTDIFLNIIGFIPLGFLLVFHLIQTKKNRIAFAILAGTLFSFGLSLMIEIIQVFIISRDSSAFDLVLNTLGGMAGSFIAAYRHVKQPGQGVRIQKDI